VDAIPYGKRLPTAVYPMPTDPSLLPKELLETIRRAEIAATPDPGWNLLKLHTDELAISFLSYPDFDSDPHPTLSEATKINLNTGTIVRIDYRARSNPPILHRKETFLPPSDQRVVVFSELTQQEEREGLYRDPSRAGLRMNWQALLKRKRLTYNGHRLITLPCESVGDLRSDWRSVQELRALAGRRGPACCLHFRSLLGVSRRRPDFRPTALRSHR